MRKIKILQFPLADSKGGMTHYALENWKWMDKNFFQCDFVSMSKQLDYEDEVYATGSKIFYISCYAETDKKQFEKEFEEILREGYDVVHLHTKCWKSFLMEELCKKHHVPKIIVHAHASGIYTSDSFKRLKEKRLHEQVKKQLDINVATDFWACSKPAADFLFGEQIPSDNIRIVPNAIDLDKFVYNRPMRKSYRERYHLENCFVIGHVGRFGYAKNHRFLIDLFYELVKKIDNAMLVCIGDGELFSEMQEYANCLCVEENILFLGRRDDVDKWYQAMDVFCLPSRMEGFPLVLVEAQASGLPCIVSDTVTEEVVLSGKVVRLPLVVDEWVKQISAYYNEIEKSSRTQNIDSIYNIRNQIRVIQRLYADEDRAVIEGKNI